MNALMSAGLAQLLMPWRHKDPLTRATGCVSSLMMVFSIAFLIFGRGLRLYLLFAVVVFIPLILVHTIRDMRRERRDRKRMNRLYTALMVNRGLLDINDLPGEVQEDVRLENARFRLDKET